MKMNLAKFIPSIILILACAPAAPKCAAADPPQPPWRDSVHPVDSPWTSTHRDAHSETWESISSALDPVTGKIVVTRKQGFVEIGTGLNFRDEQGEWQRTREEFRLTIEGYAVAEFGPHKLTVGNNINSDAAVDFVTSDGVRIRNGPLAVGYFDPVDGRNIVLATVKDTPGTQTAPNEITFQSAFDLLNASIRITYRRAGVNDPECS